MFVFLSVLTDKEKLVRVCADVILVHLAMLTALAARFCYLVAFETLEGGFTHAEIFWQYVNYYGKYSWILSVICVVVFTLCGFYTYGRAYKGRYKALIIFQAASLSYLLFSFVTYFIGASPQIPRAALLFAWLVSVTFLVLARGWSRIWVDVVHKEWQSNPQPKREVEKILVIGGAGYIGSALLSKLLAKGYQVRLLDMLLYGNEPIAEVIGHPRLEVIQADFRDVSKVVEATRGMDAVIHLGAIVGDPACALDEELTIEVNLMATRMIAEVAKGSGVERFIFASTCSVYGASDEMLDERSALNPVSLYARSKIASERVLMSMANDAFVPVCLRFGTIYGLSGRTRFDLVVNLLTAKAIVEKKITVSGGDQWRPFVHVDDAALAVFNVLEAPLDAVRNQVFNVGSEEQNYTIRQVGELINMLVPDAQLLDVAFDGDRRNYRVNFNKIRRTLGYAPQWTLERGISQVIEAMHGGKVTNYQDAKYSNVKYLSEEGTTPKIVRHNQWAHDLLKETHAGYSNPPPVPPPAQPQIVQG
ncbi:MAG: NAD(P)-dependent oxidoreductase [Blastocatellia bacterium]